MSEHLAGSTAIFEFSARDHEGNLVNPDLLVVNIEDPDGVELVTDDAPTTHPSLGHYTYSWTIPSNAEGGEYSVVWEATRGGVLQVAREDFEVVPAGSLLTDPYNLTTLRLLLSEKIPEGGDETQTLFTDTEISIFLALGGGIIDRAAAIGWAVKGGHFADMIDMTESGSTRRLNQLFTNCERMWKRYDTSALSIEASLAASASRVVGVAFNPWTCKEEPLISLFSRYGLTDTEVRMFPLKRFFAIKQ